MALLRARQKIKSSIVIVATVGKNPKQMAKNADVELDFIVVENSDQAAGAQIILKAIEAPLRQIVANAGGEPSVVVNKVLEGEGNFGHNAGNDTYGDMIAMGVLDPAKVTRSALQHAASIAGLMLTTECMIADIPEDKPAAPDMSGMGGMGSMGGF